MKTTDRTYRNWLRASIITVYLIIVAGAVVRMTGSGMGCPDWPKCFGHWVPPTERAELEFTPQKEYRQGMVIIENESLKVAKTDFNAGTAYNPENWMDYTKHDYSVFNKYHTWTEYINRLIGALGGLVVLITAIVSLRYIKKRPILFWLSLLAVFAMGGQAVLGKVVVDTVLSPVLITAHMIVALLIVGLLIYLLLAVSPVDSRYTSASAFRKATLWLILITLAQVAMGTQVRQFVDNYNVDELQSGSSMLTQSTVFLIHRSFSILLVLFHTAVMYLGIKKQNHPPILYRWLGICVAVTVVAGIAMNYMDFPLGSQAAHLVIASALLGIQFMIWLKVRKTTKSQKANAIR